VKNHSPRKQFKHSLTGNTKDVSNLSFSMEEVVSYPNINGTNVSKLKQILENED
jgi:hypothetical protein